MGDELNQITIPGTPNRKQTETKELKFFKISTMMSSARLQSLLVVVLAPLALEGALAPLVVTRQRS